MGINKVKPNPAPRSIANLLISGLTNEEDTVNGNNIVYKHVNHLRTKQKCSRRHFFFIIFQRKIRIKKIIKVVYCSCG